MGQSVLAGTIQQRIRDNGIDRMGGGEDLVNHIATCFGCAMAFCDENPHIKKSIREMSDTDPPRFVKEACQADY